MDVKMSRIHDNFGLKMDFKLVFLKHGTPELMDHGSSRFKHQNWENQETRTEAYQLKLDSKIIGRCCGETVQLCNLFQEVPAFF